MKIKSLLVSLLFLYILLPKNVHATQKGGIINLNGAKKLQEISIKKVKSPNSNFFGFVYEGALTGNVQGKVNVHPVSYRLNGNKIAANIYTPANYHKRDGITYPAVVIAPPNSGVKEQVAGLYAQKLAENGFIAMVADAAFQGASEGLPRHLDNPFFRIEDVRGMADIIVSFPCVDADRIGVLGIDGGGGYVLKACQTDKRFKAVATLSLVNSGNLRKYGFQNSEKDAVMQKIEKASSQRGKEALEAPYLLTEATEKKELSKIELYEMPTYFAESYEYYAISHKHPNSSFQYTVRCDMDLFYFDASIGMELVNQPLLMVAGSEADTLYMTNECFLAATGTIQKELFLVDGATHTKTYYVSDYVKQIVERLVLFYKINL